MHYRAGLAFILLLACHRAPEVPVNTMLWHLDRPWATPAGSKVRMAPVTLLGFRSGGEYVEFHCWVIEQADTTVYVASDRPTVMVVGTWTLDKQQINVARQKIARRSRTRSAVDPLCSEPRLTFTMSGNSVMSGSVSYAPVTRLVSPDFESYVKEARNSSVVCATTTTGT